MKSAKRKRKSAPLLCALEFNLVVADALKDLTVIFPWRKGRMPAGGPGDTAHLLVRIALANIETVAPMIAAMIKYCEREGIESQPEQR